MVSTHSRPKAAGFESAGGYQYFDTVSTHSRPKAAGIAHIQAVHPLKVSTQAARRRLAFPLTSHLTGIHVSTHSRPKAAGQI